MSRPTETRLASRLHGRASFVTLPRTLSRGAHALTVPEVASLLDSDVNQGLSSAEAAARLGIAGPNKVGVSRDPGVVRLLAQQFTGFVTYALVTATVISFIAGEWIDALAIIAILLVNGALGFIQEYRAERSLAALERMAAPVARVLRDGETRSLPAREIVPGDLVIVDAGDVVPADARVVSARYLLCQESALTGEAVPVSKQPDAVREDAELGDRASMIFAATIVSAGSGRALVVATGPRSEAGQLAMMARARREATRLQRRLEHAVRLLVVGAIALAGTLFVAGILRGESARDMLLTTVALAVAAIPEGLPAAVTIVLAFGVQRMVRRNVIVRRLESVETLGSTTVICTDKTGTLTQNRMQVREVFIDGVRRRIDDLVRARAQTTTGDALPLDSVGWSGFVAAICNTAAVQVGADGLLGDPTEVALFEFAQNLGIDSQLRARIRLVDELPFDSERQRMTSLIELAGGRFVVVMKGAPEVILERSNSVYLNGAEVPLEPLRKREIEEAASDMAAGGLRVISLAYRTLEGHAPQELVEEGMVFVSIVGLADPLRPEARPAIDACRRAGIRPMILTGDHAGTAQAIGRELGFDHGTPVVTGRELTAMTAEELREAVKRTDIYARISGEHKMRIIRALHSLDEIVAMTGDGVNDAPALNAADIGVAMGASGTEVARQASDLVLTDDNFRSIVAAVEEGRTIYANIRRLVLFLLSCNLGEVAFVGIASLAAGEAALLPVQILWVNLVTDSLPALALGVEPAHGDQMHRPPRDPASGMVSLRVVPVLAVQAALIATAALFAFTVGLRDGIDEARELAFMTLVVAHLLAVLNFRSLQRPVSHIGLLTNPALLAAIVIAMALQFLPFYLPPLNGPFHVSPLSWDEVGLVLGLALVALVPVELAKLSRLRRARR